jgi:hypothetical protein
MWRHDGFIGAPLYHGGQFANRGAAMMYQCNMRVYTKK